MVKKKRDFIQTTLRILPEMKTQIEEAAKKLDMQEATLTRLFIAEGLKKLEKGELTI